MITTPLKQVLRSSHASLSPTVASLDSDGSSRAGLSKSVISLDSNPNTKQTPPRDTLILHIHSPAVTATLTYPISKWISPLPPMFLEPWAQYAGPFKSVPPLPSRRSSILTPQTNTSPLAHPSNYNKLPTPPHNRTATIHDDALGLCWCSAWCI